MYILVAMLTRRETNSYNVVKKLGRRAKPLLEPIICEKRSYCILGSGGSQHISLEVRTINAAIKALN